jgi:hypothetical protein
MLLPFLLFVFWVTLFFTLRYAILRWRQRRYRQPARYISEVTGLDYYRRLTPEQFEWMVLQVFNVGRFTMLGDPYLGRSRQQGYAWKAGKKIAVAHYPDKPLTAEDLDEIARKQKKVRADQVLVFSPFPKAPGRRGDRHPGLKILAGRRLVSWFAALEDVRPPLPYRIETCRCDCGAPMEQRLNRAGEDLLVCFHYPDCPGMRKPGEQPRRQEAGGGRQ